MCVIIVWFWFSIVGRHARYCNDLQLDWYSVYNVKSSYMGGLVDVVWQNKPHPTVGQEKLMRGPIECWSGKNALSDNRSGKAHDSPNGLLVGKEYSDR